MYDLVPQILEHTQPVQTNTIQIMHMLYKLYIEQCITTVPINNKHSCHTMLVVQTAVLAGAASTDIISCTAALPLYSCTAAQPASQASSSPSCGLIS